MIAFFKPTNNRYLMNGTEHATRCYHSGLFFQVIFSSYLRVAIDQSDMYIRDIKVAIQTVVEFRLFARFTSPL